MKESSERIDGSLLRLARVTAGLRVEDAAQELHASRVSVVQWEHEKVHATKTSVIKVKKWIQDVESEHGQLSLPDRSGKDITVLRTRFTRRFIAERLGVAGNTIRRLQERKTFELKLGVFELVHKIRELEQLEERPDVFTEEEMKRFKWLMANKPRMIMILSKTGPFGYWTVIRWLSGTCWPRNGYYTERLRAWIKKLEKINRQ